MDLRFVFPRGVKKKGQGRNKRRRKNKKEEKRRLQLASRGFQKTRSPQASTQRQPTQESQPTEAPNSVSKRGRERKPKTKPKRQEGGRSKKEERTPMNAARSVLNSRSHHRGRLFCAHNQGRKQSVWRAFRARQLFGIWLGDQGLTRDDSSPNPPRQLASPAHERRSAEFEFIQRGCDHGL